MHSHDRCIKVVYAREEEDQPLSFPSLSLSLSLSETATDYEGSKTFKSITGSSRFPPRRGTTPPSPPSPRLTRLANGKLFPVVVRRRR